MMILEHEAKALLRTVGVAVPDGALIKPGAREPRIKAYPVAVKAQVRSGGRGKQGGVIRANPITYLSKGKQVVAIAAGSAIFTFSLE